MQVLKIRSNRLTKAQLHQVLKTLRDGGVIVYPTDSSYAIGGDWRNPNVHAHIRKIKGREQSKQFPVIADSVSMIKRDCSWPALAQQLSQRHWPGPLTFVLGLKQSQAQQATLAVRVPNAPIARQITSTLGRPIISTSANRSGQKACYTIQGFLRQMRHNKKLPDVIIDAGTLEPRAASTIVDLTVSPPMLLRPGPVRVDSL